MESKVSKTNDSPRIAALVSGGVDSSVVVHLLKEQGYDPTLFYIRIGMEDAEGYIDCPAEEDLEIVAYIARRYGCRFEEVNLHKEYWERVVSYTIESVRKGLTPNPDVMCNKLIKFGAFEQRCGKDFDRIATGHYAQTECLNVLMSDCMSGLRDKNSNNQAIKQSNDATTCCVGIWYVLPIGLPAGGC